MILDNALAAVMRQHALHGIRVLAPPLTAEQAQAWMLPPGPLPVRDWERCESCGHMGADCDCSCCWPDEPDEA